MKFRLVAAVIGALVSPAATSAEEMTFALAGNGGNCGGCEWIAAEGEIVSDTPQRFQAFIEENGSYRWSVVLSSDGGNLGAALELGEIFHDMGLSTSVGKTVLDPELAYMGLGAKMKTAGTCASACAYAFLGGVERYASEGELGVHQFYGLENSAPTKETQAIVGLLLIYLMEMDVDWGLLAQSLFTESDEMHWLTETELREFSATTENKDYNEPWQLEPYRGGLIATATHHANATETAQMTFFCRKSDGRWRLLISELIDDQQRQPDWAELRNRFAIDSIIWFSERELSVNEGNLEFIRGDGDLSYLSIALPNDLITSASDRFWYWLNDWKSARFMVKGKVPELDWLNILKRNCI
jgi:hypothetical protein